MPATKLLTPSKVTAWLDCPHYLTLVHGVERGTVEAPTKAFGEFAQLVMAKGLEHEQECLAHYRAEGKTVRVVPDRPKGVDFADWVTSVGDVMAEGADVIYQMPFTCNGMRGIADFLEKVPLDGGGFTYEPLDAKLARKEAKPGHVLQLCFYADAIEAVGYARPKHVRIWLGSGHIETVRLHEVIAYWRRLQRQLKAAMEPAADAPPTVPVKCNHCQFCQFAGRCEQEWRDADALQFVAGIRRAEIEKLEADAVATMAELAALSDEVADLQPERRARLVSQAALQVQARQMPDGAIPPHHPLPDPTPEEMAAGMAALPEPDDGDVFLDYEGHPFWRADTGLFFLFGLLTKDPSGAWRYEARWAHSKDEEGVQAKALIEYFADRRVTFPGMHVYHYNHTERSALESMAAEHGADQTLLQQLVETGLFVDLLGVVRNSLQAGVESYGLKWMERLAQYERNHEIDKGAGAVVGYDRYMKSKEQAELDAIAVYNGDDVRATLALRDWLLTERDGALVWRDAVIETESKYPEIDEQVARLMQFDPDTPEFLMGNLLGYWLREGRAHLAQLLAKAAKDADELADDLDAIVGLEFIEQIQRTGARNQPLLPVAKFRYPPQTIGSSLDPEKNEQQPSVAFRLAEGAPGWLTVQEHDLERRHIGFLWNEKAQALPEMPSVVVADSWVDPKPKPTALSALAGQLLDGTLAPSVTDSLLRAELARFSPGQEPVGGVFTDDLDDICRWVKHLDYSYVPIQGPPGTGKTYTGAHIVHALVTSHKRVGITAMSHAAIDNLLREVEKVFVEKGDLASLNAVRRGTKPTTPEAAWLSIATGNSKCAKPEFNVVAGTTWLFASDDMADAKVDVLIIDEAGQLGLADALAASRAANSIVLLGDPLQLAQVSQATHPDGAGASVLEHAIGIENTTVPENRGVFLTETRRMHPHVCTFISDEIYDSRLTSFPDCAKQGTANGTGLRWLQAHHDGRSTESAEEAALVVDAIRGLIGTKWTDSKGSAPIDFGAEHVMVVAPYNDQVRLLRSALDAAGLHRVKAGTVDKFQGQQAPVVFFTMTSSSSDDMPRDADFLFSRNRLNVAISRAKCLAYVVCTEELLNSRARDVDEMRLISTLCAAVDYAMCLPPA